MNTTLLIGMEHKEKLFRHMGFDMADGPDKTVLAMREMFRGIEIMPVEDDFLKVTVDPVPPSRHRSKRILKKLRKRLGEPYQEDWMYLINRKVEEMFNIGAFQFESVMGTTRFEVETRATFNAKKLEEWFAKWNATLGVSL